MAKEFDLLKNFDIWAASTLFSSTANLSSSSDGMGGTSQYVNCLGTLKDINGTVRTTFARAQGAAFDSNPNSVYTGHTTLCCFNSNNDYSNIRYGCTYITAGSSNAPSNYEQYCLNNDISSSCSFSLSMQTVYNQETNKGSLLINVIIRNSSANPIIIGEVGLNKRLITSSGTVGDPSSYNYSVLLGRVAFKNQITLEPNESTTLQLSVSI